ncbi:MAG TPA: hypothetical protein VFB16_07895 [Bauldia sp.]|nr:hypothetical protein [Bauldia sp.]
MSAVALERATPTFADRVYELLDRVDFRRADSEEDREAIFRLRHRAYLAEGAIEPRPDGRFADEFDELGNTWIFGVYLDGELVSSIRVGVATREYPTVASLAPFREHLIPELEAGKVIVDPTRHVVDRAMAGRYPHLVYMTMRLGWLGAEYFQADILLAAVRTEHQAFYRKVGGHRVVCGARPYPGLTKPLSLMTLDFPAGRERVLQRYPLFRSTNFERRMLFERLQVPGAIQRVEDIRHDRPVVAEEERQQLAG